jgi:hypothetical protein
MRTAHPGPRAAQATLKRKMTAASFAAAVGLIVIATGALAACGTEQAGGSATGSGNHAASGPRASHRPVTSGGAPMIRMLCAEPRGVAEVRVVRFGSRGQMGQTKPMPRPAPGITISDPVTVRRLVQVICMLPQMPRGLINCPADGGGGYVLEFSAPGERFHAVTLLASGCESVTGTGAGRPRWVAKTPLFWELFAHLTGIASPAHTQA